MQVTAKITKVMEATSGTSAAGKEWKKISFIAETTEEYNNLYCFEVFGEEKVDNFLKFNKIGQLVDIDFNVKTNEWKGKYFTSLQAWKIFKAEDGMTVPPPMEEQSDMPF